jgi:hypothetical protein
MHHHARARAGAATAALMLALSLLAGCGHHHGDRHATHPSPSPTSATHEATATPGPTGPTGPVGELNEPHPASLRDAGTQGVPKAKITAGVIDARRQAAQQDLPPATQPIPQGGVQLNPCVGGHYATNRSAYGGIHPNSVFGTVVHETIGPNVLGLGDVYGTANYLNQIGLSANDIMDAEGHCIHFVPYQFDAYAEGNFNRYYDSIEIVGTGQESRAWWLAQPIFKDHILANYLRDRLKARGVPLRLVDPQLCTPIPGFTDHNRLECGNDHTDMVGGFPASAKLSPGFPMDVLVKQLKQGIHIPITARDRRACKRVHHGHPKRMNPEQLEQRHTRVRRLHRRGLHCVDGKPRRLHHG